MSPSEQEPAEPSRWTAHKQHKQSPRRSRLGMWFFTIQNANFQIDVTVPGVVVPTTFGPPPPKATPIPAAWLATDKTEVNTMLVSFQPTDPRPLAC